MKKMVFFLCLLLVLGTGLFAQEEDSHSPQKFLFGIGWSNLQTTGDILGSFDFGFLLYNNPIKGFGIRNSILFDFGSLTMDGVINNVYIISERLVFEYTALNGLFRWYGALQGGIGIFGNKNKGVFELPLTYNFGPAFGLDIFVKKNMSIFFDYSMLINIVDNKIPNYLTPKFQMGIRHFF
jgi:hypothetical protein